MTAPHLRLSLLPQVQVQAPFVNVDVDTKSGG